MHKLKLREIGTSVGVILPKEALARLKVEKGDVIYLTEHADGFRLGRFDAERERQLATAEEVMKRRRHVLRELAK